MQSCTQRAGRVSIFDDFLDRVRSASWSEKLDEHDLQAVQRTEGASLSILRVGQSC